MTPREKIVSWMKINAEAGLYMGLLDTPERLVYFERCQNRVQLSSDVGVTLIYTKDGGYHSNGWWKNPDYERCYHLSVSFIHPPTSQPLPFDAAEAQRWARMFFRPHERLVWVEPPYSPAGKHHGVHHYRLFCDIGWNAIKPRGEVYSKQFTEIGWKSFSEIHGDKAKNFAHAEGDAG